MSLCYTLLLGKWVKKKEKKKWVVLLYCFRKWAKIQKHGTKQVQKKNPKKSHKSSLALAASTCRTDHRRNQKQENTVPGLFRRSLFKKKKKKKVP